MEYNASFVPSALGGKSGTPLTPKGERYAQTLAGLFISLSAAKAGIRQPFVCIAFISALCASTDLFDPGQSGLQFVDHCNVNGVPSVRPVECNNSNLGSIQRVRVE